MAGGTPSHDEAIRGEGLSTGGWSRLGVLTSRQQHRVPAHCTELEELVQEVNRDVDNIEGLRTIIFENIMVLSGKV